MNSRNLEIINVETKRGIILRSLMWTPLKKTDTIMILMSGICSNVFQNQLLDTTGEVLSKNGIAYIVGQASDAYTLFNYTNIKTKKPEQMGVLYDNLDFVYEDVDAYVNFAKQNGYKNIILAGHSLGSNKIIHYLSINHDKALKRFIISAPVDFGKFINVQNRNKNLKLAENFVLEGKGNDILPFLFVDFSPVSAKALLNFYSNTTMKNCPILSNDGETESLKKISINGTFIVGENDNCAGDNPLEFLKKINSYTQTPENNNIVVIKNAGHIFHNKHNEYALEVLNSLSYDKRKIANCI